jgi:5-methylcytosine-specific restriction endonuclease McrA
MPKYEMDCLVEYTDEAILAEIRRVAKLAPKGPLTTNTFDRLARVHSSTPVKRFGGWSKALARAGLAHRSIDKIGKLGQRPFRPRYLTDAEMLDELRRVARKIGKPRHSMRRHDCHSTVGSYIYRDRFGSWNEAIRRAGLLPGRPPIPHDEASLLDNMRTVWARLGRVPRGADMDRPPSRIGSETYRKRFGGFRRALAAFVAEMNGGPPMASQIVKPIKRRVPPPEAPRDRHAPDRHAKAPAAAKSPAPARPWGIRYRKRHPLAPRLRRAIPLGVRYMVLERDRFRCTACGASPANEPGCKLHVDHVVPVAKGGETLLDNLRTLCAECNIGKGARMAEDGASEPAGRAPDRRCRQARRALAEAPEGHGAEPSPEGGASKSS